MSPPPEIGLLIERFSDKRNFRIATSSGAIASCTKWVHFGLKFREGHHEVQVGIGWRCARHEC